MTMRMTVRAIILLVVAGASAFAAGNLPSEKQPKSHKRAVPSAEAAAKTHPIAGALLPSPKDAGFRMKGFYVWGGSLIKADGRFHLFASRWPEGTGKGTGVAMLSGYRRHSEIVRAIADNPLGPYDFKEVVLKGRGERWWDSQMCSNPKILRIGDTYVLYYIGSAVGSPLRKIGYAWSKSVNGPWRRIDRCLPIGEDCNNPAPYVHDDGRVLLAFRIRGLRIDIAAADAWNGTYRKVAGNICPQARLEDPDLAFRDGWYHLIAEDCYGTLTGHMRHGAHLISRDGIHWKQHDPVEAYTHTIRWTDGTQTNVDRRERPELFNANADRKGTGQPTHLITGIQVGTHTWCHVQQIASSSSKEPAQ